MHANRCRRSLSVDMAGTVEQVGPGITPFKSDDEVYGMVGGVGGLQGNLAEGNVERVEGAS